MSRKVLIIGSKGMLGQELVRVFGADENYEVIAWDKEEIDITDETQAVGKIGPLAPQVIINAAAYNAVDKAEKPAEFELAKKLNGLAPGYLAQAAKEIKIPPIPPFTKWGTGAVFVHFSTDYVFDGEKEVGYLESDKPSPISNYGISKLLGEREVSYVGGQYYIVRLQKLFGRLGQSPGAKKSFFETMLALTETQSQIEAVDEELANFTYAPDLAERTKWLVEGGNDINSPHPSPLLRKEREKFPLTPFLQSGESYPFGTYHITNEGAPATWYGAAKALFTIAGMADVKLIPVAASRWPRPAQRPKYSILLNTKLPPMRPWPEALKEFLGK